MVGLPPAPGSVGSTTAVSVGNKKRTVGVGSGVLVSVAVEVGGLVGVCVGGRNAAVWIWAASAVSKIMVSIAPGTGGEAGGTEEVDRSQADRVKRILCKRMNLCFTLFVIEYCIAHYLTMTVTETLHRVVFFLESIQVDVYVPGSLGANMGTVMVTSPSVGTLLGRS